MSSDIDKWLNEGVRESIARETGMTNGVTDSVPNLPPAAPSSPTPELPPPSKGAKSLSSLGISRGGVIRNKSTKIRTQTENPLTNPRPSRDQRAGGAKSVPDSDPLSELAATNPALAAPSIFTTMDIDVRSKPQAKAPQSQSAAPPLPAPSQPAAAPAMKEFQPTLETTIRQLLEQANLRPDKLYHVISEGRFYVKTEILTQAS